MKKTGKTAGAKRAARVKDLTPSAKAGTRVKGGLRQKKHVTKFKFEPIG